MSLTYKTVPAAQFTKLVDLVKWYDACPASYKLSDAFMNTVEEDIARLADIACADEICGFRVCTNSVQFIIETDEITSVVNVKAEV